MDLSTVATRLENLEKSMNLSGQGKVGKYEKSGKRVLACMKFGQLVLRKIIEIVATRCQILRLKCTEFDFGWGSAPDLAGGAYSALRTP